MRTSLIPDLTLGTAKIVRQGDQCVLRYMNHGSFLVGERINRWTEAGYQDHIEFCRQHDLRVIAVLSGTTPIWPITEVA